MNTSGVQGELIYPVTYLEDLQPFVDTSVQNFLVWELMQQYQQMAAGLLNISLDKLIPPGHPMYSKENSITLLKDEKEKILKENLELKKKLKTKNNNLS